VLGHTEVLGGVGRHENNTTAFAEVVVGLAGDEELAARVQAEDAVEFLLYDTILELHLRL
jgi:hypothetical protein